MANIKPLVVKNGEIQQLQAGDTLVDANGNPVVVTFSLLVDSELLARLNMAILM
jgi:hypothetical protein